ncbi:TetR family transcriptional regulator [Acuticoccus sediminis]|uniref:TetR family transcriptional regulator n=1 Tax=Acuticoccus sediminis TaxID=2184697 RepID=A0A8B2NKX3_9HYPH|nr:TetR/AcrR family transcriptional regulator [Acuticoccus sediminis]RAH96707.1 TetR family transcriptional regulator [Acuticoccus sediminis]
MNTKKKRPPGRPRAFDPEDALAVGQRLFHARGFEAVGLATLTEQLGINPPSFYGAFGSKLAFFEKVLARYVATALPVDRILSPDRPPVEALSELLETAAQTYAADPKARGCLVLEGARGSETAENVRVARSVAQQARANIRQFVAATHPDEADAVTDYVTSIMSGLSASAREGMDAVRLVLIARTAASALERLLGSRTTVTPRSEEPESEARR